MWLARRTARPPHELATWPDTAIADELARVRYGDIIEAAAQLHHQAPSVERAHTLLAHALSDDPDRRRIAALVKAWDAERQKAAS